MHSPIAGKDGTREQEALHVGARTDLCMLRNFWQCYQNYVYLRIRLKGPGVPDLMMVKIEFYNVCDRGQPQLLFTGSKNCS